MNKKSNETDIEISPDAGRLIDALRQIGYSLEQSLADLVDNSINAGAKNVLVRFIHDGKAIKRIGIADDGSGMSSKELKNAMRFGSRSVGPESLGKFGMGLKLASMGFARSVSVISKKSRRTSALQWTVEGVKRGWVCQKIGLHEAKGQINRKWAKLDLTEHGTIVLWDELDKLPQNRNGLKHTLTSLDSKLRLHLAMTYHRFLEAGVVNIFIDQLDEGRVGQGIASQVKAVNPFNYPDSGDRNYPKIFTAELEGVGRLNLTAHIWPPLTSTPEYTLGRKASSRQGFYIYRNNRLIQAGGWNGLVGDETEPHNSLARVMIDLPNSFDQSFGLNVQKSQVIVPPSFDSVLKAVSHDGISFEKFRFRAQEIYRMGFGSEAGSIGAFAAEGLPKTVTELFENAYRKTPNEKGFEVSWGEPEEGRVFQICRATRKLILSKKIREYESQHVIALLIAIICRQGFTGSHNNKEIRFIEQSMSALFDSPTQFSPSE